MNGTTIDVYIPFRQRNIHRQRKQLEWEPILFLKSANKKKKCYPRLWFRKKKQSTAIQDYSAKTMSR